MNKISIIVPVYNVELYLSRCLDSIINQTYTNFECILIDDGSTDRSGDICDKYVSIDSRFVVVHKKNEGLSVARNIALTKVTGRFISFVDSDDYILPEYLKIMIEQMESHNADIVKCDYFSGDMTQNYKSTVVPNIHILNREEMLIRVLNDEIGSQLWQYMYKRELWDGIESPSGRYAQDMMILHKVINNANKIIIIDEKLYYYFISREDSTSNDFKKKIKGAFDRAIAYSERFNFAKEIDMDFILDQMLLSCIDFTNNGLSLLAFNKKYYYDDIQYLVRFLSENWKLIAHSKLISNRKKLVCFIMCKFPLAYSKFKYITGHHERFRS